jgi:hypothetical protein
MIGKHHMLFQYIKGLKHNCENDRPQTTRVVAMETIIVFVSTATMDII